NKEEILAWQFDGINLNNELIPNINGLTNQLLSPTKTLVDSYISYNKATDQVVPVDESTTTSRFVNRDPRLDFSVGHTGSVVNGNTLNSEAAPLSNHSTGYGVIKFITDEVATNTPRYSTDYMLIRYAEVLLTYAEAKIEANDIDASVVTAINEVRSRAYGMVATDVAHYPEVTLAGQSELRNIVRNERRVELAFEGLRWFDIKRWRIAAGANGTMNGQVRGAYLSTGEYKAAGSRAMNNENRDYLRPIPQQQINLMGPALLPQNPGYQ
ncbi:MAG: RagB/SusD family nutrient uptake outer membrane protein, partial [Sphingobacteriales bacterium]